MINKPTNIKPQAVIQDGVIANPGDEIGYLCLTAGGAAATLNIRDGSGGESGDILLSLKTAANTSICLPLTGPIYFEDGAYAQLTGAAAYVSFGKY